jgi:hypothetical protein
LSKAQNAYILGLFVIKKPSKWRHILVPNGERVLKNTLSPILLRKVAKDIHVDVMEFIR